MPYSRPNVRPWVEFYIAVPLAAVVASLLLWSPSSGANARFVAAAQQSFRRVPVVVIVFDELPVTSLLNEERGIDADLFPHFASLTRDFDWFRNATTVAGFTDDALPALMTGRHPRSPRGPRTHNVFSLLGNTHRVTTVQAFPHFCPRATCRVGKATPSTSPGTAKLGAFSSGARGATFFSFVKSIKSRSDPALYFLHLAMPHTPWIFMPSGRQYPQPLDRPGEVDLPGRGRAWRDRPWLVTQAYQRHLLQLRLVDHLIGLLIERLEGQRLYDRALVVITADHGIAFRPGAPKRRITSATAAGVAAVPFFVKRPFQDRGRILDVPVETIDVLPTIADVLDLSYVWPGVDGTSVFETSVERQRRRTIERLAIPSDGPRTREDVRRKYTIFGRDGSMDLYGVAPGNLETLLEQPVERFHVVNGSSPFRSVTISQRSDAIGPIVRGKLTGVEPDQSVVIAAVVEQRIVGMTKSYNGHNGEYFYLIVPPKGLDVPLERLRLYRVALHNATQVELRPLTVSTP